MTLRAVGFDIDGTLYPDHRAQWRSIPFFLRNYRTVMAFSNTRKAMRRLGDDEDMLRNVSEAEVRYFSLESGWEEPKARSIRDDVIYRRWESCLKGMRIYPGVRDALTRLRDAGLKLAALSDFPVGNKLDYFGLSDLFDVTMGFPETGMLKPHPEPFLRMAGKLGIKPDEILYVGNRLEYDVHGAETAGMRGALIGPPARRAPSDTEKYRNYRHLADSILSEVNQ